jgi:GxxExxY protein
MDADKNKNKGNQMINEYKHVEITEQIIKAYYQVYNNLGYGFQEKVYANALAIELQILGLQVVREAIICVYYLGHVVGEYFADLLVEDKVIVETKATQELCEEHSAQLLNYLKATPYEVGLLLNFGKKPKFQRKAFDNENKGNLTWLNSL